MSAALAGDPAIKLAGFSFMSNGDGKDVNGTNAFWRVLSSKRAVAYTPTELQLAAMDYFDWCHDHPLYEMDIRTTKDDGIVETPVAKVRAFTIGGLLIFLDIARQTWANYKADDNYAKVCEWIDTVIYTQKFENAAAGLLNSNLVARDLGLADNVKQAHTSPDGSMTPQAGLRVDWDSIPLDARRALLAAVGDPDAGTEQG